MSQGKPGDLKSRYEKLAQNREHFLNRARECSALTIPSLIPPEGFNNTNKFPTPYQSVGARGVNSLASKLLVTLFPPNSPFFKLELEDSTIDDLRALTAELEANGQSIPGGDPKAEIDKTLAAVERSVVQWLESTKLRVKAFAGFKYLLVGGNALLYVDPTAKHSTNKDSIRVFRLDAFVVKRDADGDPIEIITREVIHRAALPEDIRHACGCSITDSSKDKETVDVFTGMRLRVIGKKRQWHGWQEIEGHRVPDSEFTYNTNDLPWIPLRWTSVDGEDYGRGLVEEYIGDLNALDGLEQSILEGAIGSAKTVFFVDPNSGIKLRQVAEARNLAILSGNAAGVSTMRVDKMGDFSVAQRQAGNIEGRLAFAFLMRDAIQRNAERVTAEEIRFMAEELNTNLGGAFSTLAQELQLPLISLLLNRLEKSGKIPKMPDEVKTKIVTGVEALGRGQDLGRLDTFLAGMGQIFGPDVLATYISQGEYIKRRANALGIDPHGLVKSDEEVQAAQQAAQQQAMMAQLAPKALDQVGRQVDTETKIDAQQEQGG